MNVTSMKRYSRTSVEKNYSVLGQNAFHPSLIVGILMPVDLQFPSDKKEMS
jgi:hypothetical protein